MEPERYKTRDNEVILNGDNLNFISRREIPKNKKPYESVGDHYFSWVMSRKVKKKYPGIQPPIEYKHEYNHQLNERNWLRIRFETSMQHYIIIQS